MTRREEFLRVRSNGQAKAGRFVVLSTLEDGALGGLKVGVITTKKVGKAHDRNLLRRRVRAILQRHGERLKGGGRYLVTIPRVGSAAASFEELERDWLRLATRMGLLEGREEGRREGGER